MAAGAITTTTLRSSVFPPSTTGKFIQASTNHLSTDTLTKEHQHPVTQFIVNQVLTATGAGEENKIDGQQNFDAINAVMAATFRLNKDIVAAVNELLENAQVDADVFESATFPTFNWNNLQRFCNCNQETKTSKQSRGTCGCS